MFPYFITLYILTTFIHFLLLPPYQLRQPHIWSLFLRVFLKHNWPKTLCLFLVHSVVIWYLMASPTRWTWVWVGSGSWVMDREAWRAAVHGVTKSRAQLSNWTELICYTMITTVSLVTSCTAGRFFTVWATREAPTYYTKINYIVIGYISHGVDFIPMTGSFHHWKFLPLNPQILLIAKSQIFVRLSFNIEDMKVKVLVSQSCLTLWLHEP